MNERLERWQRKGQYFDYDGYKIFYIKEGSGPVLVLFHGYPYSSYDFEKIWSSLSKRYTVVALDMIGMGFSDKPKVHHYNFMEMADIYCDLLNKYSIDSISILSHDVGNSVVQELISRNEENANHFKIKQIAFLNGGLFAGVYRPRLIQYLLSKSPIFFGKTLSKLMPKKQVTKATAEVFGKNTKPSIELSDDFWEILNYNDGKKLAYKMGRLIFEKDKYHDRWVKAMQNTKIPMTFINGPADPNSGMHMAEKYKELIPNADVRLLDKEIGHWPQIEDTENVLLAFYNFVYNNESRV
jgi:pimeloyl-ACP methyl ester carboxylesterase